MHYKDLTLYDYRTRWPDSLNIGWLENGDNFPTGNFSEREKVIELLSSMERYNLCKGFHVCDFCGEDRGNGELHVSYKGQRYQAPAMIIHYIRDHNYKPPQEFIDAVLNNKL